jgi:redox-sensitive bicupin YhaK (pirin superfamily)
LPNNPPPDASSTAAPGDLGELVKPFVFLDLFHLPAGGAGGFGYHPHSGIATLTTLFKGGVTYEDSTGAAGILTEGSVEWMRAGGGVWHTATPLPDAEMQGFQLWIALPEAVENTAPESLYLPPETLPAAGPARVILGRYGAATGPIPAFAPMNYLHVTLRDGEHWTYEPPAGHNVGWVAVAEGLLNVSGAIIGQEVAVFEDSTAPLHFQAEGRANFVLGSAAKHPHPLVLGHYSVHTSQEALDIGEAGIRLVGARLRAEGRI